MSDIAFDLEAVRRLVHACDGAGMKKLLHQWKSEGVDRGEAERRLLVVWRELDEETQPDRAGFLENWIEVVVGHVGPGARIWPREGEDG